MSIRKRLLISLLSLWTIIWAAIGLIAVERSNHEVEELLDAEFAQLAHVLRSIAQFGDLATTGLRGHDLAEVAHPYETKISFQLWQGKRLLAALGAAPSSRLADQLGYSDQAVGEQEWRVFGLPFNAQGRVLYVAQDYSIRREMVRYLTLHALQPMLWSLPLAALLIWFAVTDGLRSLTRLARDVGERSDRRLEPIADDEAPTEVRPLVGALNELMEQLRQTLFTERRFAADAAHELRTPLAIIRAHSQIARRAQDPREAETALQNVALGIDRAARLVSQLLALSRLSCENAQGQFDSASLSRVAKGVIDDVRGTALSKGIKLDYIAAENDACTVRAPSWSLEILLNNLIDNAIKFTAEGGRVRVGVEPIGASVRLVVSDSGPGIPAREREQVFDRFYRRPDQEQPGAGLGLSIVKRICDLYGATVHLADADPQQLDQGTRGLRVEITFDRVPGT